MRNNSNPPNQAGTGCPRLRNVDRPAPMRPYDGLPTSGGGEHSWNMQRHYGRHVRAHADTVRWMLHLGTEQDHSNGGIYVQKEGKSNISDTQSALFEYDT